MENNEEKKGLVFSYSEIREKGGGRISESPDVSLFSDAFSQEEKIREILLDLSFSVGSDSVLAEGAVSGIIEIECARCGEAFAWKFSEDFDETYLDSVEYIDIGRLIRETILTSLPMKPLCSPDCKGRCLVCGKNLNKEQCNCKIEKDSPFKILKNLKNIKEK